MAERTVKSRYEQVVTELPRILPLCYLVMVCIGMLFNYFKFKHFGINIFQYASVFDFLISPFEDPTIIWFMILSPIIPIKRFPVSYKKSSFGMSEKSWYKPVMRITYLALVIIYIFLFSFFYGIYTYRAVKMQDDITVRYNDNEDISGKPIGKVGNSLFLLTGSVVQIIPTDSYVKSITIPLKE